MLVHLRVHAVFAASPQLYTGTRLFRGALDLQPAKTL